MGLCGATTEEREEDGHKFWPEFQMAKVVTLDYEDT
jgi:hypothetical protein